MAGSGPTGWEDGALVGDPERPADVGGRGGEETIAWLVAPGLALIAVTYGLARFAYGLFLPDMREAFDLSPSLLGLIGAGSYPRLLRCGSHLAGLHVEDGASPDGGWRGRGGGRGHGCRGWLAGGVGIGSGDTGCRQQYGARLSADGGGRRAFDPA